MKFIVYCTTCLVNGKIYIGVHKTENPDVFDGYIGNGIQIGYLLKNPKTAFQYALKKYGYKNFKRAILYVFDNEEDAYNKEAEIVTKDFLKRHDNYNTCIGGYQHSNYKYIYRYHLDGTFWEEFLGVRDLAEKMGCNYQSFLLSCKEKRSFKNSFWSYEKVDKLNLNEYKLNKYSTIYQFSKDGEFIAEWESAKQICKEFNIAPTNIFAALKNGSLAKGFYWTKDKNRINEYIKARKLAYKKRGSKIAQYDLNGNLIKVWDSINECTKEFSKCREVAKGLRNQTKGYKFQYI